MFIFLFFISLLRNSSGVQQKLTRQPNSPTNYAIVEISKISVLPYCPQLLIIH